MLFALEAIIFLNYSISYAGQSDMPVVNLENEHALYIQLWVLTVFLSYERGVGNLYTSLCPAEKTTEVNSIILAVFVGSVTIGMP